LLQLALVRPSHSTDYQDRPQPLLLALKLVMVMEKALPLPRPLESQDPPKDYPSHLSLPQPSLPQALLPLASLPPQAPPIQTKDRPTSSSLSNGLCIQGFQNQLSFKLQSNDIHTVFEEM
jgi:hypothetical protein